MTRIRTASLMMIALVGLSACMSEGIDSDSSEGIIMITHTTAGSVYWE